MGRCSIIKVLFVGLGSIGQRHLSNFKTIVGDAVSISVYRKTNHNVLIQNGTGLAMDSLKEYFGFRQFDNLDSALNECPDIVFITNPTSEHMEVALKAAQRGCNLFIEKPLSNTLNGIDNLKKEVDDKKLTAMIGYQSRFNPCYRLVYKILSERQYGNVISASFEWGTYLPNHHSYEDYQKGYAATKNLGGGAVLGLIHDIDIICSFWGQPKTIFAIGGKLSSLEMDAEDTVSALLGFQQDKRIFPVTLYLSYAQTKEIRIFRIQLDYGTIICNMLTNMVQVFDENGKCIINKSYSELNRNDLFLEEIKEMISAVKEKRQPVVSLSDGIESLKLAMKIKDLLGEKYGYV